MRKFIIAMLLAGVAASPALAQDQGERGERGRQHEEQAERQQARQERQQVRQERQQARDQARSERASERPQFQTRQRQFDGGQADTGARNRADVERTRGARQRADGTSRWTRDNVQRAGETSRWTRDPNQRSGETGRWTRDRSGWTGDRGGSIRDYGDFRESRVTQQRVTQRSRWLNGWNRDWRNDRRYDWRRFRDRNRSTFRVGIYIDPFNYGYRSFNIGYRLQPLYYSQRYWFDPGMYGLPYPPPGTQWVRYWNDALLVDVYTGDVVDVIQNFFW